MSVRLRLLIIPFAMRAPTLCCLLALRFAADAQAQDAPNFDLLARWSRLAAERGNRLTAEQIAPEIQAIVLQLLASEVASCDCRPRRIRWLWPLANPQDPARPSLVVSFDDRPRDNHKLATFERYARLQPSGDVYKTSGVLNLGRPSVASGGSLRVQLQPRRDSDGDGAPDIALTVAEIWPTQRLCGVLRFETSAEVLRFEQSECTE